MVQYLQNNVIMKWTTLFIRFTGWIPLIWLDHNYTYYRSLSKNSDGKTPISHCDPQNLQYKTPRGHLWMEQCLTSLKYWPI